MALDLGATGLSASAVARESGIARSTVRDWLNGKVPNRTAPAEALPPPARHYAYLLGMYLGDGSISKHPRGVFRLRLHLDLGYPAIVDETERAIRSVVPANRVHRLLRRSHYTGRDAFTHLDLSCYSKRWPTLFPQHGPGRKHERPIRLADWQRTIAGSQPEQLLRGLIHSDGCRNINTGTGGWRCPRYSFSNRSEDILAIFRWACDLLDLHWTVAPRTVYVSRKADVAQMDEFAGPKM
jgi:transcriptional regulator with XRE-family HTH domain